MDANKTELGISAVESNRPGSLLDTDNKPVINELVEKYGQTQRGLKPRHVQLMAIGGSIGTALWVGIGGYLSQAGPLSLLLGYTFWGIFFIWPTYLCVAEMMAYLPVRGSIFELASRFVEPAVGFSLGWTYFFGTCMLVCVEYSAVAAVAEYWDSTTNPAVWIAVSMAICIFLNVVAVKWYGEAEFILAITKVFLLILLVLITIITMAGGNPKGDAYGFRNWKDGAMHEYYAKGPTGRFLGWWSVVIYAAFTIAGPDMIALAAGEIQNPRRTIPRVARMIFYRLVGFYIVGALAVGIICSSKDKRLISAIADGSSGAAASPWVIGIQNLGIGFLPHFINALILVSGLSCGNAYLFAASRTLYGLARDHQAPKILMKCTKTGVPIYSTAAVSLISCVTFLVASNSAIEVFFWFVDLTTTAFIASYSFMLLAYIGFYRARKAQGLTDESLSYVAPYTPYTPIMALALGCTAIFFVGFDVFSPFSLRGFITSYFAVAFTAVMYLVGKIKYWREGKGIVSPKDADLITGKAEIDEECRHWEEGGIEEVEKARLAEMTWARRAWERMW
ncbi:putative proline-specific permease put4 [Fusarium proliferatum]|uniref:Putative proline-specific permease put4 n=1 Tax=Gibberella intermedia TaxID=948311 RepID=A0A420SQF2_GIBIN|nr:putative proline-specific permease put4 [Fusarium proliferatum]